MNKFQILWARIFISRWFDYFILKPIGNIHYFFERLRKNYLFWKNVLRHDYNFDFHGHFRMLRYKLECTYKCLTNDPYTWQDPKDLKAMRICIKLAKRLDEDEYDGKVWTRTEKKWGEQRIWLTPVEGKPGYSQWNSEFPLAKTEEQRAKLNEEKVAAYGVAEKCATRDERNLYAIMLKYRKSWWS